MITNEEKGTTYFIFNKREISLILKAIKQNMSIRQALRNDHPIVKEAIDSIADDIELLIKANE